MAVAVTEAGMPVVDMSVVDMSVADMSVVDMWVLDMSRWGMSVGAWLISPSSAGGSPITRTAGWWPMLRASLAMPGVTPAAS